MSTCEHARRHTEPVRIAGFDTEQTLGRLGNDVAVYHNLLGLLADSIASTMAQLDAALARDDHAGFRAIAHSVRGMALNVGAQALVGAAAGLERQPSPQQAAELRRLLEQTRQAIRAALEAHAGAPAAGAPAAGAPAG